VRRLDLCDLDWASNRVIEGAEYGKDAEGTILRTAGFPVGWSEQHFNLRAADDGRVELYNKDEDKVLPVADGERSMRVLCLLSSGRD
jgi:hypothetical protein